MVSPDSASEQEPSFADASFTRTWLARGGALGPDPGPSPEVGVPREMAHYRLLRSLGRGAFGQVFEAIDTRTGAHVALKIAPLSDAARVGALRDEAEWLAGINRPNVPKIFGQGADKGYLWLAIELVEGRNLAEILADAEDQFEVAVAEGTGAPTAQATSSRKRTTWFRDMPDLRVREIMGWFRDLARTLDDLHVLGVLHRDIKPANIVIHRGGLPYLIDFGLGIDEFDARGQNLYLAGTVAYMSPEQAGGATAGLTDASDLYSLAVTFHEAVTGRRVIQQRPGPAAFHEIQFSEVPRISKVKPGLGTSLDPIFAHACRKNSTERYASGNQLAEDIDAWLAGKPLIHAPHTRETRRRRWLRRGAVAALGLLLVALVAWFGWRTHHRSRTFDEIRTLLGEEQSPEVAREALRLCLEHAPRYGDDPAFKGLYARAEEKTAEDRIHEFLTLLGVRWGKPEKNSLLVESSSEARKHLQYLHGAPSFRFLAAMGTHLQGQGEVARSFLAPPGEGSLLEEEVRAVSLLVQSDSMGTSPYLEQLDVIRAHPRASHPGTSERCIEAWRRLTHATFAQAGRDLETGAWGPLGDPSPQYTEARKALEPILRLNESHAAAMSLMGKVELNLRHYAEARSYFLPLAHRLDESSRPYDRLGACFFAALACLCEAPEVEGDARRQLMEQALGIVRPALPLAPEMLGKLTRRAYLREGWQAAWIWVQRLYDERDLVAGGVAHDIVDVMGVLSRDAPEVIRDRPGQLGARLWIAERLEDEWRSGRPEDSKTLITCAQGYYMDMVRSDLTHAIDDRRSIAPGVSPERPITELLELARHTVEHVQRIETKMTLENPCHHALVEALYVMAFYGDSETRQPTCEQALERLEVLVERYEEQHRASSWPAERQALEQYLRDLAKRKQDLVDLRPPPHDDH